MRAFALAVVVVLAGSSELRADEVLHEGKFVVEADVDLSKEQAHALAARLEAAWAFVAAEEGWADDAVLATDVKVRVTSDAEVKKHGGKNPKGVAVGKDTFLIRASILDEDRSEGTLAHELTHLQDRRHLVAKGAKVPHWLAEGRAVESGRAYEKERHVLDARYEDGIANVATTVTVAEAKRILDEEAYVSEKKMKSVFRMEALGWFFLEWARAHYAIESFEPKLAKVIASVGRGAALDSAFKDELGHSLAELRAAFYDHLEKTAGKPQERLAGTALERRRGN